MKNPDFNKYKYVNLQFNQYEELSEKSLEKLSKKELISKIKRYYASREILFNKLTDARLEVNYLCRRYRIDTDKIQLLDDLEIIA